MQHEVFSHAPSTFLSHAGHEVSREWVFPVAAPTEIGELLSAHSTISVAAPTRGLRASGPLIGKLVALAFGCFVALSIACDVIPAIPELPLGYRLGFGVAIAGIVALIRFSKRQFGLVTFVGENGISRFKFDASYQSTCETMLFADVTEMRTQFLDASLDNTGNFDGSTSRWIWFDQNGQQVFEIFGVSYKDANDITNGSDLFFGIAAANAWNKIAYERERARLSAGESTFRIFDQDSVRVVDGGLEFTFDGKSWLFSLGDLDEFWIDQGILQIVTKSEKWSRFGKLRRINCSRISNLAVFLDLAEEEVGLTVE